MEPSIRPGRHRSVWWAAPALALGLDLVTAGVLFPGRSPAGTLAGWAAIGAPVVLYWLVANLALCSAPVPWRLERLAGTLVLCAVHTALTLVNASLYAIAGPLPWRAALAEALWGTPGALLLQPAWALLAVRPVWMALFPSHPFQRHRPLAPRRRGDPAEPRLDRRDAPRAVSEIVADSVAADLAPAREPDAAPGADTGKVDRTAVGARLAAVFGPFGAALSGQGALDVDAEEAVPGVYSIFSGDMAKAPLVRTAARLRAAVRDTRLGVDQITVRAARGALVVTLLDGADREAPALVAGSERPGTIGLIEFLSRRAADECRAVRSAAEPLGAVPTASAAGALSRRDAQDTSRATVGRVLEGLEAFGPVVTSTSRDASADLTVHVIAPVGVEARALAQLAGALHRATDDLAGTLGSLESIGLTLEGRRAVVRPLLLGTGGTVLLAAAGGDPARPGLALVQAERAADRLAADPASMRAVPDDGALASPLGLAS